MLISTRYFNQPIYTAHGAVEFDDKGEAHADEKVEKALATSPDIEYVAPKPVKKAPAKKVPVKKAPAKKAPAKKEPVKEPEEEK